MRHTHSESCNDVAKEIHGYRPKIRILLPADHVARDNIGIQDK